MKIRGWKRHACAALLTALSAFTYKAAAAAHTSGLAMHALAPCVQETFLRADGLVRLGGYELNVTFTPEGRFVRFDITKKGMRAEG